MQKERMMQGDNKQRRTEVKRRPEGLKKLNLKNIRIKRSHSFRKESPLSLA
jgi:hypothetical protein